MINTFTDKMTYHTKKKLGPGILSVQIHVKTTCMPVNYLVHLDNIAVVCLCLMTQESTTKPFHEILIEKMILSKALFPIKVSLQCFFMLDSALKIFKC